jgi:DNA-directed RNA polymerase subunit H (RpoH/RPB5)
MPDEEYERMVKEVDDLTITTPPPLEEEEPTPVELHIASPGEEAGGPEPLSQEEDSKGMTEARKLVEQYGEEGKKWEVTSRRKGGKKAYTEADQEIISKMRAVALVLQNEGKILKSADTKGAQPRSLIIWMANAIKAHDIIGEGINKPKKEFKNINHEDVILHKKFDSKEIKDARDVLNTYGIHGDKLPKLSKKHEKIQLNSHLRNTALALQNAGVIPIEIPYPTNKSIKSILKDMAVHLTHHDKSRTLLRDYKPDDTVHKNTGNRIKILVSEIDNGNTSLALREELKDTAKYAYKRNIIPKDLYEDIIHNYVYDI